MKHFALFPSLKAIAEWYDVSDAAAAGFTRRHEVPPKYDLKTLEACQLAGFTVEFKDLAEWHEAHREWRAVPQRLRSEPPEVPWLSQAEQAEAAATAAE